MYDVAIIGAGPAGSTLARLIGQRYRVLIADRRIYNESSFDRANKSCGGLLAPDAQAVLARLGLGLPGHVLASPQLFAVRAIDLQSRLERYYQRHYINIDRAAFDTWLASLIPDTVDKRWGWTFRGLVNNPVQPARNESGFQLRFTTASGEHIEKARIVISAEGAVSVIRQKHFPDQRIQHYIAIQEWFESQQAPPYFSALFDPEITDFYAWTIPKGNRLLLGAALKPGSDAARKFEALHNKLQSFGFNLGRPIKREGAFILRPMTPAQIITGREGIALIGESAGWISPSSSEGLSWAMKSAMAMAESLLSGLDGFEKRYRQFTAGLRTSLFAKQIKAPLMYHPGLRKMIMLSGLSSLTPVGDPGVPE